MGFQGPRGPPGPQGITGLPGVVLFKFLIERRLHEVKIMLLFFIKLINSVIKHQNIVRNQSFV